MPVLLERQHPNVAAEYRLAGLPEFFLCVGLQFEEAAGIHRILAEADFSLAGTDRQKIRRVFAVAREQGERCLVAVYETARREFF